MTDTNHETSDPMDRSCRCEATIAPSILEGYACGNPACWRTPIVKASFDAFVLDLVAARGEDEPKAHHRDQP